MVGRDREKAGKIRARGLAVCSLGVIAALVGGCGGGSSGGTATSSVAVTFSPASGSTGVLANATVSATFAAPSASVVQSAKSSVITVPPDWSAVFTLVEVGGDGTNFCSSSLITYADNTATCSPLALRDGRQFAATMSGLKDSSGRAISDATATFSVVRIPGDFNGDGYADLLIGAAGSNLGDTPNAYLYFGSSSGIDTATRVAMSQAANSAFGRTGSLRGDFNGDGLSDALIGAPYVNAQGGVDRAYLYLGSPSPSNSPAPAVTFTDGGGTDRFGDAITAGDFNGDGYGDAVIGAPATNSNAGRVYVYSGSASMDGTADLTLDGAADRFGESVAAGDSNADGYDDLAVGAPNQARVYTYQGSANGLSATASSVLSSGEPTAADGFGGSLSSSDFNGDGYADLAVSAGSGASGAGRVYIFYGAGGGITTTAGATITGEAGSNLGAYLSSGDFNGDGYADALVGTDAEVGGAPKKAFIYFGASGAMDGTPDVTFSASNEAGSPLPAVTVSSGDFNRDGFADAVVGSWTTIGRVDVYVGSGTMGGTPNANISIVGQGSQALGCSVSGGASP